MKFSAKSSKFISLFKPYSQEISPSQLKRSLTLNTIGGAFGISWFFLLSPIANGVTGNMVNVFFKNHLGGSASALGMLVAFVNLTAVLHLVSIFIYNRLSSIKAYWWINHVIARILGATPAFVAIYVLMGGNKQTGINAILICLALAWVFYNSATSGWFAWMTSLIPENMRASYFGRRAAIVFAVGMLIFFLMTLALDIFHEHAFVVFAVFFLLAGIGGVFDVSMFLFIPEPKSALVNVPLSWQMVVEPVTHSNFRRFLLGLGLFMFSTNVLAPFVGPYLTAPDGIGAPNIWLGILTLNAQLAYMASVSYWGMIMDRLGRKPVVLLGSLYFLSGIGWFFISPNNYVFIIPVMAMLMGILGPAIFEGANQLMMTLAPPRNRTTYISWYFAIVGVANASGAILGGFLSDALSSVRYPLADLLVIKSFHIVVMVYMALCMLSFYLISRIKEGGETPVGVVLQQIASASIFRTMGSIGVIGKPEDSQRVARALRLLEGQSSTLAVRDILPRLDDPDAEVREEAARALGRIKSTEAVEPLIQHVNNPESSIRVQAARSLGKIGDRRALPYLVALLNSSSEELQEACVHAIGQMGDKESISRLLQLFNENRSDRVMGLGAQAVSRHGVLEAVWEIFPRMHQTQNSVLRRQLAIALGNLLGKPGEFYRYLTGDRINQSALQEQLFDRLHEIGKTIEEEVTPERYAAQATHAQGYVGMIKADLEHNLYAPALQHLSQFYSYLVRLLYPHAGGDDESLIAFALYHNQPLGLAIWLVKETEKRYENGLDEELLRLDVLLGLYGLSYYQNSRTAPK
jgi:predicted MFS family arabinose efflux permease